MKILKEFQEEYPQWFRAPNAGYYAPEGWEQVICLGLHCIEHKHGRWLEVEAIKARLEDEGLLDPNHPEYHRYKWCIEYFEKNPTNPYKDFHVEQLKEKFGGLRFYWSMPNSNEIALAYVNGVVAMTECFANRTCAICGERGQIDHSTGWSTTICETCKAEQES